MIDITALQKAIAAVKRFKPAVLIVSQDQFNSYVLASIGMHFESRWLFDELRKLGIKRIIYADYLENNTFEFTSEDEFQRLQQMYPDLETFTLHDIKGKQ